MVTVSVIIPCFNLGVFIEECVDSVRAQDVPDSEIIVVDDESTDDATPEALERLARRHPDLRLLKVRYHNVALARNAGFASSQGRFVLFLDADDALGKGFLVATIGALEARRDCGVAYTDVELFGEETGTWRTGPWLFAGEICLDNYFQYCSLIRRDVLDTWGGFNPNLRSAEDWDFWVKLYGRGVRFVKAPDAVAYYRKRAAGKLATNQPSRPYVINRLILNHKPTYERVFLLPIGDREEQRTGALLRAWDERPGDPALVESLRRTRLYRQFKLYHLAYRACRRVFAPMYVTLRGRERLRWWEVGR